MSSSSQNTSCQTKCWIAGAVLGVVLFFILWLMAGLGFFWSLVLGGLVLVGAALLLQMILCADARAASGGAPHSAIADPPANNAATAPFTAAQPEPAPAPVASAAEPDPVPADAGDAVQPSGLATARDGGPDDLKRIKGIGPKLEQLLHSLGIFHFDQVAAWGPGEVAWMDDNLAGFKGRVTRDNWVEQAGHLAAGGETDFSRKVDGGDVY